jgi:hypothetical protein
VAGFAVVLLTVAMDLAFRNRILSATRDDQAQTFRPAGIDARSAVSQTFVVE